MQTLDDNQLRLLKAAILLLLFASQGLAQLKPSQGQISQQTDDIVRVTTELVQAGVTVLDKEGELVNGLQREQFELYIDGKPQPILFFESIFSGTKEERQIESSAVDRAGGSARKPDVPGLDPGRTVFFFVDDLHLAPGSLWRTRQTLLSVINETMGRNDHWAVVSTSGQIGFLQQVTNNRAVMHAAVERLNPIPDKVRDGDRPPITEYAALMINEQRDRDLFRYFVDQTMKVNRMEESERPIAAAMVQSRARLIVKQSDAINRNVLLTLESLIHSAARLAGRKVVFFLSDGFVLNLTGSDVTDTMRRLTDAAVRANVVIYSVEAKGLTVDSQFDASNGGGADTTGVLSRALTAEHSFTQEGLYALASDTGGHALLNSNAIEKGILEGLKQTSVYYILAWKPSNAAQRDNKFHQIEVKVAGRPDLKVLVQRGYFSLPVKPVIKELQGFSSSIRSENQLPIKLNLTYERANGSRLPLTASMKIDRLALLRALPAAPQNADVELMGAVMDARGKPVGSFLRKVNVDLSNSDSDPTFKYLLRVLPGLYQVRVAAVDPKTKRMGEAAEWIEIPVSEP